MSLVKYALSILGFNINWGDLLVNVNGSLEGSIYMQCKRKE